MPPTLTHDELVREIKILEPEAIDHAQADDKLYHLEQEKKAILDSMQEYVIYLDSKQRVVWANKAARELVHMTDAELKGSHCFQLYYQQDKACSPCPVTKAMKSGQPAEMERTTRVAGRSGHRSCLPRSAAAHRSFPGRYAAQDNHGFIRKVT